MKRLEQYNFVALFGDGKEHSWFEVINLGVRLFKVHQRDFERKFFKKGLEYGLIKQIPTKEVNRLQINKQNHEEGIFVGVDWRLFNFVITPKGDECLREEQIKRLGDYNYYKTFDRTVDGPNGVQKFAPINRVKRSDLENKGN